MSGEWTDGFELIAEAAYARMYDAKSPTEAAAHYSDAKEALHSAIGRAEALNDGPRAVRLRSRLAEIKAVYRSQFA